MTFAAAAASYLEHQEHSISTKTCIRKLLVHFGAKTTCRQINQALMDRAGRTICPNSKPVTVLRQVVAPTRAILNHAARRGWCDVPRFETAKGGGKRTDWITPIEAEAMVAGAAPHFQPLLLFLFCTGARVGEAVTLEWTDVNLQFARAVFRDTKNGDDRQVDLPPRAVAALANLPEKREGRVFLHPTAPGRPARQPYRATDDSPHGAYGGRVKRAWATAVKAAGISRHLTPHHARHTWATWHYGLHKDLMRLRENGGWHTVSMCDRYAKLAPDMPRTEIAAFWGVVAESLDRGVRIAG